MENRGLRKCFLQSSEKHCLVEDFVVSFSKQEKGLAEGMPCNRATHSSVSWHVMGQNDTMDETGTRSTSLSHGSIPVEISELREKNRRWYCPFRRFKYSEVELEIPSPHPLLRYKPTVDVRSQHGAVVAQESSASSTKFSYVQSNQKAEDRRITCSNFFSEFRTYLSSFGFKELFPLQ